MADSLEDLRRRLAEFARARDWEPFHDPKNLSMALIAEAAELVEHFQWLTPEQSRALPEATHREVELELADILIFLIRCADQLGVDLVRAANDKTDINEERFPTSGPGGTSQDEPDMDARCRGGAH